MALCSFQGCGCTKIEARGWCCKHYTRFMRWGDTAGVGTQKGDPIKYINEIVLPYAGNECLTWPYGNINGYAYLHQVSKSQYAHRYVCEIINGAAPTPEHEASHSCGKGHLGCISPNHLSWKTRTENQADRVLHGTTSRGDRSSSVKLTKDQVLQIRQRAKDEAHMPLALEFGVACSTISNIFTRQTWAWLEEEAA